MINISNSFAGIYTLEQLADGDTIIHRLNPIIKLITTFIYIVMVVSFNRYDLNGLIPYLFYPFIVMALSEVPYHHLLKRLILALPFSLLAGISNIIFDTETAFLVGGIGISFGLISFLTIILKTYLTVMAVLILVATTSMQNLSAQMVRLKVPADLVMQITMTYRYIGILINEAATMFTAYLLRSPKQKGIRIHHMGSFIGQLLLRSIDRAERIYYAMKCRGFQGAVGYLQRQELTITDYVYGLMVCSISVIFRFVNVVGLLGKLFL